jgi:hypothetical protein
MRTLCLLGASGNIGSQSLDVIAADPASFCLKAVSVGHHVEKIPGYLETFSVDCFRLRGRRKRHAEKLAKFSILISNSTGATKGSSASSEESNCDLVENALVGFAGLVPSLTSLRLGKILCLSNKESLRGWRRAREGPPSDHKERHLADRQRTRGPQQMPSHGQPPSGGQTHRHGLRWSFSQTISATNLLA